MSDLFLGPLDALMADEEISDIVTIGLDKVYVEIKGKLRKTDVKFASREELDRVIDSIVKPLGKNVDYKTPLLDGRLPDGSRVNIAIEPVAIDGPLISIRKFSKKMFDMEDLISVGSLSRQMLEFIKLCVVSRQNIIISGGTGSGKTSLLNIASSFIPEMERIVTIEDAAELQLRQEHVARLESRPPDIKGQNAVPARRLVINALRMRPDRIIVGECRGGEALDMLQAMNTGHDGSLTTVHSNSPRDCLKRLDVMVLMAGLDLPMRAIREQVSSAINLIIQLSRFSDGSRKITDISQITGMEGDIITLSPIFEFKQTGIAQITGKVLGEFKATGTIPTFLEELKTKSINVDMRIFE